MIDTLSSIIIINGDDVADHRDHRDTPCVRAVVQLEIAVAARDVHFAVLVDHELGAAADDPARAEREIVFFDQDHRVQITSQPQYDLDQ